MQIVIDIPEEEYKNVSRIVDMGLGTNVDEAIKNGTPLDDVKAEIQRTITASWYNGENYRKNYRDGLSDAIEILDNISKAEGEE